MMERDHTIDMMKGVAIIFVIIGHSCLSQSLMTFIYLWHMPLFFIISGYLWKQYPNTFYIKKSARHILAPYGVACLCIIILAVILYFISTENRLNHIIPGALFGTSRGLYGSNCYFATGYIHALWFLPALFMCQVVYNVIHNRSELCNLLTGGGLWLVGMVLCSKFGHLPLGLLQGMCGIIFFQCGHLIRKYNLFNAINIFLLLLIGIPLIFMSFRSGLLGFSSCRFPSPVINLLGAICFALILYRIIKIIGRIPFWEYLGKISILILCIHAADYLLDVSTRINNYLSALGETSWINLKMISMIAVAVIGGILMSRIPIVCKIMSISAIKDKCKIEALALDSK